MAVAVRLAAAEQPSARDVHRKAEAGDGNGLGEADRNRLEQSPDRFVADEQRDHRQHDGAGEPCEVAEFSRAESEAVVLGVAARETVG